MLPPSLGDPDLAGFGGTLLDDLAPEMSKIMYVIKVRIAQQRGTEGIGILGEKSKKVRIKPALIEQPPLNIDGNDEYRPRQETCHSRRKNDRQQAHYDNGQTSSSLRSH
jgi:hypothetical protein